MPVELANDHNTTPLTTSWALFGATGVTGQMVLQEALRRGHRPLLIGRASSKLDQLAAEHGLEAVHAGLDETDRIAAALAGRRVLLNVAGPFGLTGGPLMAAAMAAKVAYADLNGELPALEDLLAQDQTAKRAGVALVGGTGFGIAASDGLAAIVSEALGGAERLRIAVAADSAHTSPAVEQSTLAILAGGGRAIVRRALVRQAIGRHRWTVVLPDGSRLAIASAPLADLVSARHATGADTIIAGVPMPAGQALAMSVISPLLPLLLKIPAVRKQVLASSGHAGAEAQHERVSRVWVEGSRGKARLAARLDGGEGYALAAQLAVLAVEALCTGRIAPGAHTPATAFGSDFIRKASGVTITLDPPA